MRKMIAVLVLAGLVGCSHAQKTVTQAKPAESPPVGEKQLEEKAPAATTGEVKPTEAKPVEAKPAEAKPAETKPMEK
jgi:hypothetical protein